MCGLPLVQQCWWGSGPGELIGVKVETLDTPPSWQTAVVPRHAQLGLFGWHATPITAREVWPLNFTYTHTHQSLVSSRSSSLPTCLMPWQCTSAPDSPPCPSLSDTTISRWSSSPCWSRLSESLSGWEETSPDRCPTTLHGNYPPRGATLSGEGGGCLGNYRVTRVWLPWRHEAA